MNCGRIRWTSGEFGGLRGNLVDCGRIWWNVEELVGLWEDSVDWGGIRWIAGGFGGLRENSATSTGLLCSGCLCLNKMHARLRMPSGMSLVHFELYKLFIYCFGTLPGPVYILVSTPGDVRTLLKYKLIEFQEIERRFYVIQEAHQNMINDLSTDIIKLKHSNNTLKTAEFLSHETIMQLVS